MPRPKGSKNKKNVDNNEGGFIIPTEDLSNIVEKSIEKMEEQGNADELTSVYEAAQQLKTNEHAIKLWVSHGHLKEINGRITVRSIKECRFNNARRFR